MRNPLAALHLDLFDQPAEEPSFSNLLGAGLQFWRTRLLRGRSASKGRGTLQVDCKGNGSYDGAGNTPAFGPIATTRMMCPAGSLDNRLLNDLWCVRSYSLRYGHLYLALMANGGADEFATQ